MSYEQPSTPELLQKPDRDNRLLVKFESFRKRYDLAMRAWATTHGNTDFPILFDQHRVPRWINRAERRRYARNHR
jgi:hypothetical protein